MKRLTINNYIAFLALTLSVTPSGCELFSASTSNGNEENSLAGSDAKERAKREPGKPETREQRLDRLFENLVYVWRDRTSCSGLRITIPETAPEVQGILLSGHCISGNPVGRSSSIKSPKFVMRPISRHGHQRIGEFLADYFFANTDIDYSQFEAEVIDESSRDTQTEYLSPWTFPNDENMLAIYHTDFEKNAWTPLGGIVHRDYFSLLRQTKLQSQRGVSLIMQQNDLALIPLIPEPPFSASTKLSRPAQVRSKPITQPGDRYFALYLGRDNVKRELQKKVIDTEIIGFAPKHGLIQGCEQVPKDSKDYVTDRGAILFIERSGEFYAIGLGSFGSPAEKLIAGKRCALTTFTHIVHHNGWIKLAYQQAVEELQSKK